MLGIVLLRFCCIMDLLYEATRAPKVRRFHERIASVTNTSIYVKDKLLYGKAAVLRSEQLAKENNGRRPRGWLNDFIIDTRPELAPGGPDFKKFKRNLQAWRKRYLASLKPGPHGEQSAALNGRGAAGYCNSSMKPSQRKRGMGAGRHTLWPEGRHELFQWFVDTLRDTKARIGSSRLLMQANTLKNDSLNAWQIRRECGEVDEAQKPKFPVLSVQWLAGWRRQFGITWRTINLRYKCSWKSLVHRLDLFWTNVFIIRWLHAFLFPEGLLRFENADEKPLWFATAAMEKTLAMRGQARVGVKENVHATRDRFTVMTRTAWPDLPDDGKGIAVCFKARSGVQIRRDMEAAGSLPNDVLLQFGPCGSYRLEQKLEYYKWLIPVGPAQPANCTLQLADWFAPNLHESVRELVESRGHAFLNLPGSVTGHVQTNDTHGHMPYSAAYKRREMADAEVQIRAGASMPSYSRNTVLNRANAAWKDLNHRRISRGFVQNGIAGRLNGEDDDELTVDVAPVWNKLNMSEKRRMIGEDVRSLVESGEITDFFQYNLLLVPYPNSKFSREGHEAFSWYAGKEDDTDSDADENSSDSDHDGAGMVDPDDPYMTDSELLSDLEKELGLPEDDREIPAAPPPLPPPGLLQLPTASAGVPLPSAPPIVPAALDAVHLSIAGLLAHPVDVDALEKRADKAKSLHEFGAGGSSGSSGVALHIGVATVAGGGASSSLSGTDGVARAAGDVAAAVGAGASPLACASERGVGSGNAPAVGASLFALDEGDAARTKAQENLWTDEDEKSMKASTAALISLQEAGGDRVSEPLLERRIAQLRKRKKNSNDPQFISLRDRALSRAHEEAAVRQSTRKAAQDLQALRVKATIAAKVAEKRKAEGKIALAAAREKETAAKAARLAAEAKKKNDVREMQLKQMHFAEQLVKRIEAYFANDPTRVKAALKACEQAASKPKAFRTVVAPRFWTLDVNVVRDVTLYFSEDKSKGKKLQMWASEAFAWQLFGRKTQEEAKDHDPRTGFRKLIQRFLPGYMGTLAHRYKVAELLTNQHNCFDLAFVEATWRYSKLVGPGAFPPGLHEWPPGDEWKHGLGGAARGSASGSAPVPLTDDSAAAAGAAEPVPLPPA